MVARRLRALRRLSRGCEVSMNQLSWPAAVLIGIVLGLAAVAADRQGDGTPAVDLPVAGDAPAAENDGGTSSSNGTPAAAGSGSGESAPDTGGDGDYVLTLTFDDGPHPTYTPQVLDLLEQYDATAVFCVTGEQAHVHPDLVEKIVEGGHALCNHTYSHDSKLSERTADEIEHEIAKTNDAIEAAADADVPYFRQPSTYVQPDVLPIVESLDMRPLDWTIDARDWSRPGTDSIVQDVLGELQPGAVILLHDGGGDRSQTVAALEPILRGVNLAGYRYVMPPDKAGSAHS